MNENLSHSKRRLPKTETKTVEVIDTRNPIPPSFSNPIDIITGPLIGQPSDSNLNKGTDKFPIGGLLVPAMALLVIQGIVNGMFLTFSKEPIFSTLDNIFYTFSIFASILTFLQLIYKSSYAKMAAVLYFTIQILFKIWTTYAEINNCGFAVAVKNQYLPLFTLSVVFHFSLLSYFLMSKRVKFTFPR